MPNRVDPKDFRAALSRFASGVTVVTTRYETIDHAMTVSAFSSLSIDPPLVLICADRSARFLDAVLHSGLWAVSILAEEGRETSAWLARKGRPLENQLDEVPHHRGATGMALMDQSLSWLECETHEVLDGGDHLILIGKVVNAGVREELDDPLLYYRSHYGTIVRQSESEKTVLAESADSGPAR